jgi:ComF family protein
MFLKSLNEILSFFFPLHCIICKKEGGRVCGRCLTKVFKKNAIQKCPVCLNVSKKGRTCTLCKEKTSLDALFVVSSYEGSPQLQSLLKQLKYRYSFEIAELLALYIGDFLEEEGVSISDFHVSYVPLHWRRYLERGFNQSALIANALQKPYSLLRRVKNIPQQAKLSRFDRLKNVKNAFSYSATIYPEKVLLIDDVASTGATLNACAKELKRFGVKEVWGCVIARNQ